MIKKIIIWFSIMIIILDYLSLSLSIDKVSDMEFE